MRIWATILFLCLLNSTIAVVVQLISTDEFGSLIRIEGAPYYALAPAVWVAASSVGITLPIGFLPLTSIHVEHSPIERDFLEGQISLYENSDDVWNKNFLESVSLTCQVQGGCFFDDEAIEWVEENKIKRLFLSGDIKVPKIEGTTVVPISAEGSPPGPYVIDVPSSDLFSFHEVCKLFRDDFRSFVSGLIPRVDGNGWVQTNLTLPSDPEQVQLIPVPSRLARTSIQSPLSGLRFGLRDTSDAQGAGSAEYAPESVPSVGRLIDLGAALVGRLRTSQSAHHAHPWEFFDYTHSLSPREDSQLTAPAPSSGCATAIAVNRWLDFTVGGGDTRVPASLVGVYGIRPTPGSLDLTGLRPLADGFDTVGFFARDPVLLYEISQHWYGDSPVWPTQKTATRFPRILYYPTEHFPLKSYDAQGIVIDTFVKNLKLAFNITHVPVNFTDKIAPYFPSGDFAKFQLYSDQICEYHSCKSAVKPSVDRYTWQENKRKGLFPDPIPQAVFDSTRRVTKEQYRSATSFVASFASSISENVFKRDSESCSDSLFIYDAGTGRFPYLRDDLYYPEPNHTADDPNAPAKFSDFYTYLGSMAGLPEVTIPLVPVSYFNRVDGEWDNVPVTVQLVARAGCDAMLLDLVKKMAERGVVRTVNVGSFQGEEHECDDIDDGLSFSAFVG